MRPRIIWLLAAPVVAFAQQGRIGALPLPPPASFGTAPADTTNPKNPCVVTGEVRNAVTGEPVSRAGLLLRRTNVRPNSADSPISYRSSADESGRFVLKGVEPGRYRLSSIHAGFVAAEFGAREPMGVGITFSLEAGQQLQNVIFALTPQAVLAGRILDERGDPIPFVQVQALGYRYDRGQKQLASFGSADSNDLGEYRIFGLPPGRYYLSATYRANALEAPPDLPASQAPDEDYVPTYYPRGTDPAFATTVEARPGAQLEGMDFVLSKSSTVHIRGRVDNPMGGMATVRLAPGDQTRMLGANRTYVTDRQGRFDIRGITPGPYTLIASVFDSSRSLTARRRVEITNNLEDVEITIQPPLEVTGRVRIDGDQTPDLSNIQISLRPRQPGALFGPFPGAKVEADGDFTLSNVSPDDYYVIAVGLPNGYYVKSIKAGHEDILDTGFNVNRASAGPIGILLSPQTAQVEGAVLNAQGQAAPGATVVMVPNQETRRNQVQYYAVTTTDQQGRFRVNNVDPGEYKAFAWEDVEFDAWMDPDFLQLEEDKGAGLVLGENSHEEIRLKLIPATSQRQGELPSVAARP